MDTCNQLVVGSNPTPGAVDKKVYLWYTFLIVKLLSNFKNVTMKEMIIELVLLVYKFIRTTFLVFGVAYIFVLVIVKLTPNKHINDKTIVRVEECVIVKENLPSRYGGWRVID